MLVKVGGVRERGTPNVGEASLLTPTPVDTIPLHDSFRCLLGAATVFGVLGKNIKGRLDEERERGSKNVK